MKRTPCIFFDRDGIINQSPGPGYVERVEDFHLLPDFPQALRIAQSRGYRAVVVTNQRGVALGLVHPRTLEAIHLHMHSLLAQEGLKLDGVYVCPHDRGECTCRKPMPGMLLRAAEELNLALAHSWMIGDHETDITAGRVAGCRTIRVGDLSVPSEADERVSDMSGLPALLEALLPRQSV
ncbi:MAG: HAD family hydrolase [Kiritimatiellae bacterium]|nr:HAD family hydrolase [Kiritimatiellia bacterium]MDD4734616.1 HAD family hydrolase [Kiritimatiellia bacterium]